MVDLEESESDQEDAPSTGSFQSVSFRGSSQSLSRQSVSVSGSSQSVSVSGSSQSVSVSGSSQSVQGATSGSSQSVPASETGVLQDSFREEEDEISQPLVVNTVPVQDLSTNTEYLEREETTLIQKFLSDGCGCDLASESNCSTLFRAESVESYRRDCSELTRAELDMTLLGQLAAFTNCSALTAHSSRDWHPSVSRQRSYSLFWHGGRRVCKKTFLFLHTISDKRLRNLQRNMRENGLAPRRHGNLRRLPSNAISYIDTQRVVEFLRGQCHPPSWAHPRVQADRYPTAALQHNKTCGLATVLCSIGEQYTPAGCILHLLQHLEEGGPTHYGDQAHE